MNNHELIAISGGIGSGKSVVCEILRVMGYEVYDCDSRAKSIMDNDFSIKRFLVEKITPDALFSDGSINRKAVAAAVFSDTRRLEALNSNVHRAVARDLKRWFATTGERVAFVETAILYQSGLDLIVDEVWEISAPDEIRISRVMSRNNCPRKDVEARIDSQNSYIPQRRHPKTYMIVNDGETPVLSRVEELIRLRE